MADAPSGERSLNPFERHVKHALRYLHDPQRLSRESPLASAYMLSRATGEVASSAAEPPSPGEALVSLLRATAATLWPGPLPTTREAMLAALAEARRDPSDPRYAYLVLELRCFQDLIAPRRMAAIWEDPELLLGSKSQHYRDFDAAVQRLAELLLDRMRPAYAAERPRPPALLLGYADPLAQLSATLRSGGTVGLSGPGGVGKTSLASQALAGLAPRPVFWYTLRPGFNASVGSLLFALGVFLHEHGASGLWRYLASAGGEAGDLALAAGLLRADLVALTAQAPILCFDDLEHLAVGGLDLTSPVHAQLLDLLDGLRGVTPLLLIGQRPLLGGDLLLELRGLNHADTERLCLATDEQVSSDEVAQLYAETGGNPRLLLLLLSLRGTPDAQQADDGVTLGATRALLPAFQRHWRRLTPDERRALQQLAVYPYPAPADTFAAPVLAQLERQRLITLSNGAVILLPALARIIYDELSPELRAHLHLQAGGVRLERGEVTAAAYHFAQAGDEDRAVQVWFPQRRLAVARGEADAARAIFGALAPQRLAKNERKALAIMRAELRQLAGQAAAGLHELEQADWSEATPAGATRWRLRGEFQAALGDGEQALLSYHAGLQLLARLLSQRVTLHQRHAILLHQRRDLGASWQAIQRAEFDLELMRGLLLEEQGHYPQALDAYGRAAALGNELGDDLLVAQVAHQTAALHGRREELSAAIEQAARAIAIYERSGDQFQLAKLRGNLAAIYVQTRQFPEALEVGNQAYAFFTAMGNPYYAASAAANLAEASYGLNDFAQAVHYAEAVLALEEPFAAPYALFTLGQVALRQGQTSVAAERLHESMQRAETNADPYMVAYARRALGEAILALHPSEAEAHLRAALAAFRELGIPSEAAATEELLAHLA